jgi:hypothetical protein
MSASSHVDMHRARMASALSTGAGRYADRLGRTIANTAKEYAPVDEGRLRASITHIVTMTPNSAIIRVGSPLQYAKWIHEGTGIYGPHKTPIVPVTAKALKFRAGKMMGPLPAGVKNLPKNKRGFVFAKSVKGVPPTPFLTNAMKQVFGPQNVRVRPTT